MKRICKICGKEFNVSPSYRKRRNALYCSRACYRNSFEKKIKRTCKTCGIDFYIYPSQAKRGIGIYCSKNCYNKSL